MFKKITFCLTCVLCCLVPIQKVTARPGTRKQSAQNRTQHQREDLKQFLQRNQMRVLQEGPQVRAYNNQHQITFKVKSPEIFFNGTKIYLSQPIQSQENRIYINKCDSESILYPLLHPQTVHSAKNKIIVIDPGHGGKAEGARNNALNIIEKNYTLKTACELQKALQSLGYKVHLTRNDDRNLSLKDRSNYANRLRAKLFISIHYNASQSESSNGIETYAYTFPFQHSTGRNQASYQDGKSQPNNRFDQQNTLLAYYIHRNLINTLHRADRGLRHARFGVLKDLNCPGVLIECGFISNQSEALHIKTEPYQKQLIRSIVKGIQQFETETNFSQKKPLQSTKPHLQIKRVH